MNRPASGHARVLSYWVAARFATPDGIAPVLDRALEKPGLRGGVLLHTILVPLDGSALAEQALPHAATLARSFDARLVIARVPEPLFAPLASGASRPGHETRSREAQQRAEEYLSSIASREALTDLYVETLAPSPPVAAGLIAAVDETGAGLVVMTTHGRSGIGRWVLGGVADKLVRAAPAPVYLVRATQTKPVPPVFANVVVPLDGSPLAEEALDSATSLAQATGARLLLVRVPTLPGYITVVTETAGWIPDLLKETALEAENYLNEQVDKLAAGGINATGDVEVVVSGGVADGILSYARQCRADAIVMSTHGRSGLGRWVFGSVADRVLRSADAPVWLVRAGTSQRLH